MKRDSKTPWILANELPTLSKEMLNLIIQRPKMISKEIQEELGMKSGHTFSKYMNLLSESELVIIEKDGNDKRRKKYLLSDKGRETQEIVQSKIFQGLKNYFKYCEQLFFIKYPEHVKEKGRIGYIPSDSLFKKLQDVVFKYIEQVLTKK